MKLCLCMGLLALAGTWTPSRAQTERLTLKRENASMLDIIRDVERQSRMTFVYSMDAVNSIGNLSIDVKNVLIDSVMNTCLRGTDYTWSMEWNVVVIKRKGETPAAENQRTVIRGTVTDSQGEKLPGVSIYVKGTTVGVITNDEGAFALELPASAKTLVFSFVGMKTREIEITNQTELQVVMEEEMTEMAEVVVTGYGDVAKGNYTGAAYSVKAEDVLIAGVSTIDQMLQGMVPGMLVMNRTGQVGATPKIRVRGTSTLLGSQEPVWVVDGVIQRDPQPFNSEDNTNFSVDADDIKQLAGNAISWLNPNDIESITVLKDASATAIYGSQAANGVIVITTKKGTTGKAQVSYSGDFSIGQRPRYGLYDLMNSEEIMQLQADIYKERRSYSSSILPIGYAGLLQQLLNKEITFEEMNEEYKRLASLNTNWFDILFRNSFNHSHNISISGGNDKVLNRTSLGYTNERGEAKGNDLNLFTATSNTTVNFGETLMLNLLLKGSIRNVESFAYGVDPFTYAYSTSRAIPAYNEDGSYFFHEKVGEYSTLGKNMYNYNILNESEHTGSKNKTRTWGVTLDLKWKILKGLEYQFMFSYASLSSDTKSWASEESFYITQTRGYEYGSVEANSEEEDYSPLPHGGILETDMTNSETTMVRNALVYDHLFNDVHRMTLQFGVETNSIKTQGNTMTRYGYLPGRGETFVTPPLTYLDSYGYETGNEDIMNGDASVVNRKENFLSEYFSAIYSYNNLYVVNFNGRVDASNRFGQDKNKRFEPTWSVGFKWRAANERFLNFWWLNNMDVYVSFGYQGNAVTTVSPYLIAYDGGLDSRYNDYVLEIASLPYPDLGWEKTKTWNVGIDGALLNGRLNFTFNWYKKISDVLSSRNIPYENGFANGIVSGSTLDNTGYDFVIDVVPIRTENTTWQISLNTSVTSNSVDKNKRVNTLTEYLDGSCVVDGRPYSTFYSYEFAGLNPENGHPTFAHMDIENAESPKDYLVESGKFLPDFSGGLNTTVKWKNLSLYALFSVQWGGHARLPKLYSGATDTEPGLPRPEENVSRDLLHRWKQAGDEAYTSIPSLPGTGEEDIMLPATANSSAFSSNLYHMYNMSDERVANTDFIRCRSLSLTYDFQQEWLERLYIKRLQLKASMTNPFMWVSDKKWDGLDPETGDWPARRVTSLSLQIMF